MTTVLPPTYDRVARHDMMPQATHDETARLNALTNLNVYLGKNIFPGTKLAYEKRVRPAHIAQTGREFESQREIRDAMKSDPLYQAWAALRRTTMEMRQQAGRHMALRQIDALNAKAEALNAGKNTLQLDERVSIPDYLAAVDNHWMPGSYYGEAQPGDVSAGASYDAGVFVTTAGSMSARGDGGGRTLGRYVKERFPGFNPKRILDLGCGIGTNTVPLAAAFPDAEIIAVDVAGPSLRYGHARAQSLGFNNIQFVQANAETVAFPAGHFDWVQTTMVLHETSPSALRNIMKRARELLAPGGLMLHLEQPNFTPETPLWDRFTRDWDAWYNNEPFWAKLHVMNVFDEMADAGFAREELFEDRTHADIEPGLYQAWASTLSRHSPELKRKALPADGKVKGENWYLFGAKLKDVA